MSIHDLQLLADGFGLGAYSLLGLQIIDGIVQDRRDARAVKRQQRIAAADCYYRSLRRYQRQVRFAEMYPAGVIEVSARRIELDLNDGLDRVERAAREEGLL